MRFSAVLTAAVLTLCLSGCQSELAKDLDLFCEIVLKGHGNGDLTPPERLTKIEEEVASTIKGQEFGALYKEAWEQPRDKRHEFMQTKAKENGLSYWRCTAIDHLVRDIAGYEFDQKNPPINLDDDENKAKAKKAAKKKKKKRKKRKK